MGGWGRAGKAGEPPAKASEPGASTSGRRPGPPGLPAFEPGPVSFCIFARSSYATCPIVAGSVCLTTSDHLKNPAAVSIQMPHSRVVKSDAKWRRSGEVSKHSSTDLRGPAMEFQMEFQTPTNWLELGGKRTTLDCGLNRQIERLRRGG